MPGRQSVGIFERRTGVDLVGWVVPSEGERLAPGGEAPPGLPRCLVGGRRGWKVVTHIQRVVVEVLEIGQRLLVELVRLELPAGFPDLDIGVRRMDPTVLVAPEDLGIGIGPRKDPREGEEGPPWVAE